MSNVKILFNKRGKSKCLPCIRAIPYQGIFNFSSGSNLYKGTKKNDNVNDNDDVFPFYASKMGFYEEIMGHR